MSNLTNMLFRNCLTLVLLFTCNLIIAQTGIGTTTPHASAKLDVSSTNKGFLPPRVTLTSVTDVTTITSPAEGLFVYNLGSVGLQAGYYYWNGANWATIATATSAGNGVTSMDMTKLYAKRWASGSVIESTNGQSFTVPVSGRYMFDFSSSCYAGNAVFTYIFQIRNSSNGVLAADTVVSANNYQHVEFNGKVEVNLQANTSYNVYVNTTGVRDVNDYDRVYYKLVAGNLPVTGQSVDYVSVVRTTSQSVNTGDNLIFNTINGGNIPYNSSNGTFSLSAGKTYRLTGSVSMDGSTAINSAMDIAWKTAAGDILGNRGLTISTNYNSTAVGNGLTDIVYTPTINTTVSLNVISSSANAKTVANYTYANIEQIGSSAIINPWTLSGTNTYNTTGNVGIGTASPTAKLDVSGNVNVTGKISLTDPTGSIVTKAAGFVERGADITLGNLKVRFAASGNMSLQVSSGSGSYTTRGSDQYITNGSASTTIVLSITTTPTYIWPDGINFAGAGNSETCLMYDTTAGMTWRIIGLVGPGYSNNFISIERIL